MPPEGNHKPGKVLFFIDPMSYNNLGMYDYSLLKNVKGYRIRYYGSIRYDRRKLPEVVYRLIFRYSSIRQVILKSWSYLCSLVRLWKDVRREKPALVHIQWIRLWAADYLFLRYLVRKGIPVVYTAHNVLPHDSGKRYFRQYARYYSRVTKIIVHTAASKAEMIRHFGISEEKVEVIPHGILDMNTPDLCPEKRMERISAGYGVSGKIVFAALGMHSFYKGSDLIVKLWSEDGHFRDNPDIQLFMWGKSTNVDLRPLEGVKNVSVRNEYISNEDYLAVLRLSDVVLLPYRTISQSGVLMSVIQERVPFLVSEVGGLTEPLQFFDVGWSLGAPSYENFRQAMLHLLADRQSLKRKKESGDWEKLKEKYSWETIGRKTTDLYDSLIK